MSAEPAFCQQGGVPAVSRLTAHMLTCHMPNRQSAHSLMQPNQAGGCTKSVSQLAYCLSTSFVLEESSTRYAHGAADHAPALTGSRMVDQLPVVGTNASKDEGKDIWPLM